MVVQRPCYTLPQDITEDILKRLPVKSLIRFESVSKDWLNLFKDPVFIAEHLQHSTHKNPLILIQRSHKVSRELETLSLCLLESSKEKGAKLKQVHNPTLINSMSPAWVVGSCHGLLCIRRMDRGSSSLLALWNPATRKVRQVPPGNIIDFNGSFNLGFGFSPVHNDFKIVRIRGYEFDNDFGIIDDLCVIGMDVYSMSDGSWKEIQVSRDLQSFRLRDECVHVNGAMYWFGTKLSDFDDPLWLVSFDLGQEVSAQTTLPNFVTESNYLTLAEYKSKLAILSLSITDRVSFNSSLINIWVPEDTYAIGERWTILYSIGPIPKLVHPSIFWRNSEIVCEVEDLSSETELEYSLTDYDEEKDDSDCNGDGGGGGGDDDEDDDDEVEEEEDQEEEMENVLYLYYIHGNALESLPVGENADDYCYITFNHVESLVRLDDIPI